MRYIITKEKWAKDTAMAKRIGVKPMNWTEWKKYCEAGNRVDDYWKSFWLASKALGVYWRKVTTGKVVQSDEKNKRLQELEDRLRAILQNIADENVCGYSWVASDGVKDMAVLLSLCFSMRDTTHLSCGRNKWSIIPAVMDIAGERQWNAYQKRCKKWNNWWK